MAGGMTVPEPVSDESGRPIINNAGELAMRDAPRYGMHSLRHACASLLLVAKIDSKVVSSRLGHGSAYFTQDVYQHVIAGVQEEGTCWLAGTTWQGRGAMRISVSNWATTADDAARSAAAILGVWRRVRGEK